MDIQQQKRLFKMIIPIKCFTCGKVIADKWLYYQKKCKELETQINVQEMTIKDITVDADKTNLCFDSNHTGKIMDEIGLTKMCCRRHMLGHVDLIDII
jgi:DNA-directed RNA polymerase subunit N (RpoN/RPB10)